MGGLRQFWCLLKRCTSCSLRCTSVRRRWNIFYLVRERVIIIITVMRSRGWGALKSFIDMVYLTLGLFFSIDFPIFMILITFISLIGTAIFYQNNTTIVNGMFVVFGPSITLLTCIYSSYRQSDTVAGFHRPLAMVYFSTYPWTTTHNNTHPYPFQSFHCMSPLFLRVNTVCRFGLIAVRSFLHFFILSVLLYHHWVNLVGNTELLTWFWLRLSQLWHSRSLIGHHWCSVLFFSRLLPDEDYQMGRWKLSSGRCARYAFSFFRPFCFKSFFCHNINKNHSMHNRLNVILKSYISRLHISGNSLPASLHHKLRRRRHHLPPPSLLRHPIMRQYPILRW